MSMLKGGENRKHSWRKRQGFLARAKRAKLTGSGSHMLAARRAKGRQRLAVAV